MKLICTQENLKTGLQTVTRIISSSITLPILNTVLLRTENGQLKISATNLEMAVNTFVRCKIEQEGGICVPAKILTDLIGSLPNKNITLELVGNELLVASDKAQGRIKTLNAEDFPIIPKAEGEQELSLNRQTFSAALDKIIFAASTSDSQPEISGILMALEGNSIVMAATDRYRLAEIKLESGVAVKSRRVIIPKRTASEVSRAASSATNELITVICGDTQISFQINGTQILSRLIDGEYPDYKEIIPSQFNTKLTLNRQGLLSALKTVAVFSESSGSVNFVYKDSLKIEATSQAFGGGETELLCSVEGPAGAIIFNHRYLQDMLLALNDELIEMRVVNDASPVIFSALTNKNYLYLVMPIKI